MTKVAIVILNWNGEVFLEKFLPGLISHSLLPGVEIIVADNSSSDGSLTMLRKKFSNIRIIRLEKNHGFAGGYNRALQQVEAKYYLLLNSDIEVTENWLDPLVAFMDKYNGMAACSPVLLDYKNRSKYEYAGAAGGYIDKYGYTFCRGRIFNTVEEASTTPVNPIEVFWTTGACMLVRSELFRKAGGFDDHFFAHMEEVDLCWRLKNRGQKLAVVPDSKVYHVGGGTLPNSNPYKTYLNFRNNLLLLYKNLPEEILHKTIRRRMLLDGFSAVLFLVTAKPGDFRAVIRAHAGFRRIKKAYRQLRNETAGLNRRADHPEIYQHSLVFDYFAGGKKYFRDLRGQFGAKMDQRIFNEPLKN
ncbi:MAG: glycosyltransferase family 2 protein [Bacteroidales bacterium]